MEVKRVRIIVLLLVCDYVSYKKLCNIVLLLTGFSIVVVDGFLYS